MKNYKFKIIIGLFFVFVLTFSAARTISAQGTPICDCVLEHAGSTCSDSSKSICVYKTFIDDVINTTGADFNINLTSGLKVTVSNALFKVEGASKVYFSAEKSAINNENLEIDITADKYPLSFVDFRKTDINTVQKVTIKASKIILANDILSKKDVLLETTREDGFIRYKYIQIKEPAGDVEVKLATNAGTVKGVASGRVKTVVKEKGKEEQVAIVGDIFNQPVLYKAGDAGKVTISGKYIEVGSIDAGGHGCFGASTGKGGIVTLTGNGDLDKEENHIIVASIDVSSTQGCKLKINPLDPLDYWWEPFMVFGYAGKIQINNAFRVQVGRKGLGDTGSLLTYGLYPSDIHIQAEQGIQIGYETAGKLGGGFIRTDGGCVPNTIATKCDYPPCDTPDKERKICGSYTKSGDVTLEANKYIYVGQIDTHANEAFWDAKGFQQALDAGGNPLKDYYWIYAAGNSGRVTLKEKRENTAPDIYLREGINAVGFHINDPDRPEPEVSIRNGEYIELDGPINTSNPGESTRLGLDTYFIRVFPEELTLGDPALKAGNIRLGGGGNIKISLNSDPSKPPDEKARDGSALSFLQINKLNTSAKFPFCGPDEKVWPRVWHGCDGGDIDIGPDAAAAALGVVFKIRIILEKLEDFALDTSGTSLDSIRGCSPTNQKTVDESWLYYGYSGKSIFIRCGGAGNPWGSTPWYVIDGTSVDEKGAGKGNAGFCEESGFYNGTHAGVKADGVDTGHDYGPNGGNGGDINIRAHELRELGGTMRIDANGGDGAQGGTGGEGGICPDANLSRNYLPKEGMAGTGGNGGSGGEVVVEIEDIACFSKIYVYNFGGKGGRSGSDGLSAFENDGGYDPFQIYRGTSLLDLQGDEPKMCDTDGWEDEAGIVKSFWPPARAGNGGNGGSVDINAPQNPEYRVNEIKAKNYGGDAVCQLGSYSCYSNRDTHWAWEIHESFNYMNPLRKLIVSNSTAYPVYCTNPKTADQIKAIKVGVETCLAGAGTEEARAICIYGDSKCVSGYVNFDSECRTKVPQTPCQERGFTQKELIVQDLDDPRGYDRYYKVETDNNGANFSVTPVSILDPFNGQVGGWGGNSAGMTIMSRLDAAEDMELDSRGGKGDRGSNGQWSLSAKKAGDGGAGGNGGDAGEITVAVDGVAGDVPINCSAAWWKCNTSGGSAGAGGDAGLNAHFFVITSDRFCINYINEYSGYYYYSHFPEGTGLNTCPAGTGRSCATTPPIEPDPGLSPWYEWVQFKVPADQTPQLGINGKTGNNSSATKTSPGNTKEGQTCKPVPKPTFPWRWLVEEKGFCCDGKDNDNDGLMDCQDPDCHDDMKCYGTAWGIDWAGDGCDEYLAFMWRLPGELVNSYPDPVLNPEGLNPKEKWEPHCGVIPCLNWDSISGYPVDNDHLKDTDCDPSGSDNCPCNLADRTDCGNIEQFYCGDGVVQRWLGEECEKDVDCPDGKCVECKCQQVANLPPDAVNLQIEITNGCFIRNPIIKFSWEYQDPNNVPEGNDPQSNYLIQISDMINPPIELTPPVGGGAEKSREFAGLDFDKAYIWRVKVWDSGEPPLESEWKDGPNIDPIIKYPWPAFDWEPKYPPVGVDTTFTNTTETKGLPAGCFVPPCTYEWDFTGADAWKRGVPPDPDTLVGTTSEDPITVYFKTLGEKVVKLSATDKLWDPKDPDKDPESRTCTVTHTVDVGGGIRVPKWIEIQPF